MDARTTVELPESSTWLNARLRNLHDFRGRALVLAFVNAGSLWCIQRLNELLNWRARNPGYLQLLVIHVPRLDSEREPTRVLKLLHSHGVRAPILLDREWEAWRRFAIESWPTLVLIDAQGRECQRLVGDEGDLDKSLQALCEGQPLPTDAMLLADSECAVELHQPLCFPAGLAVSESCLYVADSGHHRILECTLHGRVLRQFGIGTADLIDGGIDEAAFNRPRGLALGNGVLYVADSGNHALRRIDLHSGRIDTLCGDGHAGEPVEGALFKPSSIRLDHLQDVALANNQILLAMAGDNRIWIYDLGKISLRWHAGAGTLEHRDGNAHMAAFAQPCALAAAHHKFYVCDALGAAVRSLSLRADLVQTLVGRHGIWPSDDLEAAASQTDLQYPQAIAVDPGSTQVLWIADAGNGGLYRLRVRDAALSKVSLPRTLQGPGALALSAGTVWIAETDAHAVLCYDIAAGGLSEFQIKE